MKFLFGLVSLAAVVMVSASDEALADADGAVGASAARSEMALVQSEQRGNKENWVTTGGDFFETRFSQLSSINTSTVADLGFAWDYDTLTQRGMEATPVVVDGKMFFSGTWGQVYALNAATGEELWYFDPEVPGEIAGDACCDIVNRGVAVWDGMVYVAALNGDLIGLDAETGAVVWRTPTVDADNTRRYTSTGAPRVAGDVVVIGNAGADFNARGYFGAYDIKTGAFKWRFYTVPASTEGPHEHAELAMAAETWDPNSRFDVGGGGTVWDSMAYDAELDLLYVGTGNSAIYPQSSRSPAGGDNLFLSSILAVRPATGELVWHYQTTPGESWDYTSTQNMILAEQMVDGVPRKVLYQAPKNGFFYVLDRETGELISAEPYVPVNWASHIDLETGRPVFTGEANYFDDPKIVFPAAKGGHGWRPMALSEETGLVYIPVYEDAELHVNLFPNGYEYRDAAPAGGMAPVPLIEAAVDFYRPVLPYDAEYLKEKIRNADAPPRQAYLRAWDPLTQTMRWEVKVNSFRDGGGVLATAGGLVFHSTGAGLLEVYDDATGELLHSIETGTGLMAAPTSYEVDGEQYIAVLGGLGGGGHFSYPRDSAAYKYGNAGRLIAFKLGGSEVPLPPEVDWGTIPEPPARRGGDIAMGQELFIWHCSMCHHNNGPGIIPDLRRLGESKHAQFDAIVREGALLQNGMPNFGDVLDKDQTDAIQSFLIELSWMAYSGQSTDTDEPTMTSQ
eukprot:s1_g611.t1